MAELHLRVALVFTVITPCLTVEVRNLTAVVGGSITFPDPVTERGFLNFVPKTIATVYGGTFEIEEDSYTNRLHWSDGLFTLTRLQKTDSGRYSIDSKKGTIFSRDYELKVYDSVPDPVVSIVNVTTEVCTVECSANKIDQTTLSWFKGEDSVNTSSSGVLPLTVGLTDYTSGQTLLYTCVAQNPTEKKTVEVDLNIVCKLNKKTPTEVTRTTRSHWTDWLPLAAAGVALAVFVIVVHVKTERKRKKETRAPPTGL